MPTRRLRIRPRSDLLLLATGEGVAAQAGGPTASFPNSTNEPADVSMATLVDADLSSTALDTPFTSGGSYFGMTQGSGFSNMTVRLVSDQSWRTAGSAIPTCPAGDRILVCAFAPNGSNIITAGEKGLLYKACPSGTKTIYLRWYGLVSSNWYGQAAASFKKFYFRCASTQPAVFLYNGSGGAGLTGTINYQAPNTSVKVTAAAMTRNVWALWEVVAVCPTTAGGTDGHLTVYKDGVRVYQRTDFATGATTWGEQQFLNYYGGTGDTTVTAGNGTQYSVVGDGFYFSTSTSRAAVPA